MLISNVTLTGNTVLVTGVAGFIGSNLAKKTSSGNSGYKSCRH